MIEGLPNPNVPLSITINALPYQEHEGGTICEIQTTESSPFISTASDNACINIWNTELGLVKLVSINFRKYFEAPKQLEGIFMEKRKEKITGNDLFEDELPYGNIMEKGD